MKSIKSIILYLIAFGVLNAFLFTGCSKDDDPVNGNTPDPVPDNIFPLTAGHVLIYNSGSLLSLDTDVPIAGSDVGYESKWIIAGKVAPGPSPFTQPTVILDTTKVFGQTVPRTFLAHHDTVANEFHFLTNLGYFFRSQKIYTTPGDSTSGIRADSLRWILLAKPSADVGVDWVAFNETFTSNVVGQVRLEIKGEFEAKENLTAGGTDYVTYRLVATRRVYLGSSTTSISTSPTAKLWMAENVGPVKIELRGDAESNGKVQTLTAKNF
ncbi:MAG: hypothetical protein IPM56_08610 [Ignavibacteriales bacterium]|nr:MAG: hypothetical protein IPM56_08610 [Ignavibacteriales bacterium]